MTVRAKVLSRLQSQPKDFSWNELRALMEALGYELKTSGGSGRKFLHPRTKATLFMHEPHPRKVLKKYQVRDAIAFLKQEGRTS